MFLGVSVRKKTVISLFLSVLFIAALAFSALHTNKIQTNAESQEGIKLPIIMYHSVLKDNSLNSDYVVSPSLFEEDLKYIRENGYTTIFPQELSAFVLKNSPLPKKPIILTFDDGYYNNYHYVLPLLKKYNMKAVVSPIMKVSEEYSHKEEENSVSYGYLTFSDIRKMYSSGCVEFANHSYDLHSIKGRNGVCKMNGEDIKIYKQLVSKDIKKAQDTLKNITGKEPVCMVYPFGAFCDESELLIKEMGFELSMTCTSGCNIITKDRECLYKLKRFIRPPYISSQQLFSKWESD